MATDGAGRPGKLGDAAGATTFFASRAGAYITGAALALDGGMSL
jgi:NAD(P)-dependent dehydrogenase (short-subunit alcohol dehydrogenase family)